MKRSLKDLVIIVFLSIPLLTVTEIGSFYGLYPFLRFCFQFIENQTVRAFFFLFVIDIFKVLLIMLSVILMQRIVTLEKRLTAVALLISLQLEDWLLSYLLRWGETGDDSSAMLWGKLFLTLFWASLLFLVFSRKQKAPQSE